MRCNAGHCATAYHPLCGRNNGQYLAIREGPAAGRSVYRSYCALHSEAQREKDLGHAIALEGPASVLRKEAKRRQALDRANAAALEALEERQAERATLTRTRLDLESLRILLQRVVKRERLKREGAWPLSGFLGSLMAMKGCGGVSTKAPALSLALACEQTVLAICFLAAPSFMGLELGI